MGNLFGRTTLDSNLNLRYSSIHFCISNRVKKYIFSKVILFSLTISVLKVLHTQATVFAEKFYMGQNVPKHCNGHNISDRGQILVIVSLFESCLSIKYTQIVTEIFQFFPDVAILNELPTYSNIYINAGLFLGD